MFIFRRPEIPLKYPGKLITFEGLDGCGKSTQLAREAERLRQQGYTVFTTHEPGGTAVGQQIREIVLHTPAREVAPFTELALMFAARTQHIEQVILPALEAGQLVLCDRFTDSSVAYQGYGRGIPLDAILVLDKLLCHGVRPDLTLVLDIDTPVAAARTNGRNQAARETATRFEREGAEFFERVRNGYREIARQEPERVRLVEGRGSISEVQDRISNLVDTFLEARFLGSRSGI
ncbi:MAG: dTMP kinase [Acidobacteria bacterium]|nr:dTMP kinase [Acidobacteriota bacterium]